MIPPKQRSFWHHTVLYPPSCTCPPIRSAGWKESATNQPLGDISVSLPYLPSLPLRRPHATAPPPDAASLLAAPASPSRHRLPATPPCPPQSRPRRRAAGSCEPPAPSSVASTSEEVLLSASPFAGPVPGGFFTEEAGTSGGCGTRCGCWCKRPKETVQGDGPHPPVRGGGRSL